MVKLFLDIIEQCIGPKPNGTRRVLILENEESDGVMLCRIVEVAGFEPDLYVSQRDAERAMRRFDFAAGIFDLKLLDGRGEEAQKIFEGKFREAPSMLVSGDKDALVKIVQGGVGVITSWKDQDSRLLKQAVERMLSRAKPATNGKRWTSKEVLLGLAILVATNYCTYKLCTSGVLPALKIP